MILFWSIRRSVSLSSLFKVGILGAALSVLTACASPNQNMGVAFSELCGQSYSGGIISEDPQDVDWRSATLIVGPVNCDISGQIEMPLAVGADKSRTWFVTEQGNALELRHRHLLKDGSLDPVTNYGGVAQKKPTLNDQTWRVEFPADDITVDIFNANGLEVSTTNVWAFEIKPGKTLTYELTRENRDFRAQFDLSNPL